MKKNLLRILSLVMAAAMLLCLFACDNSDEPAATTAPETTVALTTEAIKNENTSEGIKNIILIIGDGMGLEHIAAGQLYAGKKFEFTEWQFTNVNTDSITTAGKGPVLTDSAASGTALATGKLTVNSYVGKNHLGTNLTTILDAANKLGKSTGVVTTDALHGATPAAFSGHTKDRTKSDEIVNSQLSSNVNLLCGTTDSVCTSKQSAIQSAGYAYCDNFSNIDSTFSSEKAYWQFDLAGKNATVQLCDTTVKALNYLNQDSDGFVLMVEQAHIDKYSHNNEFSGMVKSVKSLNDTVEAVMAWIGDRTDTAVLVTADHETGGLTITTTEALPMKSSVTDIPIYFKWQKADHTNSKVGLFVYGVEVDFSKFDYYKSNHLIKNIDVYNLMYDILHPTEE